MSFFTIPSATNHSANCAAKMRFLYDAKDEISRVLSNGYREFKLKILKIFLGINF